MQKLVHVIARPAAAERVSFQRRMLEQDAPAMLERTPAVRRFILNLVDVEDLGDAVEPPYDVVAEIWLDTLDDLAGGLPAYDASLGAAYLYHVAERIQLDRQRVWPLGERSPGVKTIYLVRRHAWLSDHEAAGQWRQHAPLARRHHVGMAKYVQNGVIAALTPGAPIVHGIAELHFATRADLEQRMYDSAAGGAAIAADAAKLVAASVALHTSEYVLRE